jgi:hypothetical protein
MSLELIPDSVAKCERGMGLDIDMADPTTSLTLAMISLSRFEGSGNPSAMLYVVKPPFSYPGRVVQVVDNRSEQSLRMVIRRFEEVDKG